MVTVGQDEAPDIGFRMPGGLDVADGPGSGPVGHRVAHIPRVGVGHAVEKGLIGQRQVRRAGHDLPDGMGLQRISGQAASGGNVIDSGAVGGDGVLDTRDCQHIGREGVEGPPAGNDDMDAPGNGVFQSLPVALRQSARPVQGGHVQVQGNAFDIHGIPPHGLGVVFRYRRRRSFRGLDALQGMDLVWMALSNSRSRAGVISGTARRPCHWPPSVG